MRVTDVLSFNEYWKKYKEKRSDVLSKEFIKIVGDNIYEPIGNGNFQQKLSLHSKDWKYGKFIKNEDNYNTDLSANYVLISDDFYYFGKNSIDISKQPLYRHFNRKYPPRTKFNFDLDENVEIEFVNFIRGLKKPKENAFYPYNKDKIMHKINKYFK
jgi:hypothetical protein